MTIYIIIIQYTQLSIHHFALRERKTEHYCVIPFARAQSVKNMYTARKSEKWEPVVVFGVKRFWVMVPWNPRHPPRQSEPIRVTYCSSSSSTGYLHGAHNRFHHLPHSAVFPAAFPLEKPLLHTARECTHAHTHTHVRRNNYLARCTRRRTFISIYFYYTVYIHTYTYIFLLLL